MTSFSHKAYAYIAETTGIAAEVTPFFAAYETLVLDMDTSVSQDARIFGVALLYLGLGKLYNTGRELSQKGFAILQRSERVQTLHDIGYNAVFTAVVSPVLYFASGERDVEKILFGTLGGAVLGTINGAPVGYAIDVAKDLMGVKPCERGSYPSLVRNASPFQKRMLATWLLLGSLGLTEAIYAYHDSSFSLEHLLSE